MIVSKYLKLNLKLGKEMFKYAAVNSFNKLLDNKRNLNFDKNTKEQSNNGLTNIN